MKGPLCGNVFFFTPFPTADTAGILKRDRAMENRTTSWIYYGSSEIWQTSVLMKLKNLIKQKHDYKELNYSSMLKTQQRLCMWVCVSLSNVDL